MDKKTSDSSLPPSGQSSPPGDGRKVKPRQIIFSCAGKKDGKAIKERIPAKSLDEAHAAFVKQHGVDPFHVDGPFYEVKGTSKSEEHRVSITLKGRDMVPTPQRWTGTFKGWKGYFNGIKAVSHEGIDYEDNELVRPAFDELADKSKKVPRPRFGPNSVMRLSDVENVQLIED